MPSPGPSDPSRPGPKSAGAKSMGEGGREQSPEPVAPGLYIVSTPIGNLRDITLRALDVLAGADAVLAEDTRVAAKLLSAHGIRARISPYHDHNAAARRPELLAQLKDGARLALISDAGTPLVSDPGWKLVREALAADIPVRPVPGPSAMLAGLVTSGLPSDRFLFAGFLPPRASARRAAIAALKAVPATLIFYESGPRLADCLADLAGVLGDREAAIARELTKLFEETRRGRLAHLAHHYAREGPPRGEIVVLVGPPAEDAVPRADIEAALMAALEGQPVKAAAETVATALGLPKREVYQLALRLKSARGAS